MRIERLGELTQIKTGKLDVNAGHDNGFYPFFTCAVTPYKINEYAFDCEAILVAGNGDLNVKYYEGKFNAYQRTYVIQKRESAAIHMKYLYYFMETYIRAPLKIPKKSKSIQPGGQFHLILKVFLSNN